MYTIYLITNTINGKRYVGQTKFSLTYRFNKHCISAKGRWTNQLLHQAIRKYGRDAFKIEPIVICSDHSQAMLFECYFIKDFCTNFFNGQHGYNMTNGGEGCVGYKLSDIQRAKISQQNKGRKWTPEARREFSKRVSGENNPRYGTHQTQETKDKISAANKGKEYTRSMLGKTHSSETIEKMRLARLANPPSTVTIEHMRAGRAASIELTGRMPGTKEWTLTNVQTGEVLKSSNIKELANEKGWSVSSLYSARSGNNLFKYQWRVECYSSAS